MSDAPAAYPWESARVRIYGWKQIGARVGLSATAAWRYSKAEEWNFPLPKNVDPKGVFAYEDELTFWFARWTRPAGEAGAFMRRRKTEPEDTKDPQDHDVDPE